MTHCVSVRLLIALSICWIDATMVLAQRPPAPVVATRVIESQITPRQSFVATVRPTRTAVIGSAASGRVAECFCDEGDRVKSMQPLAQLLTETISSDLAAAEAELRMRESILEELENGARPEEIEQAKVRMLATDARRAFTKLRRSRFEALVRQGNAATLDERDEAVALDIEAQNEYLDAKAAHDLAVLGPRPEKIAQARAQVAIEKSIVKKLIDQKRKHTIISRFDGYVIRKHTEVGAWVNTSDEMFEVAALDEVDVEAFVTEKHVPNIYLDMEIAVEIPALDNRSLKGKVKQIVPQADLRTRTFPISIRVENQIENKVPLLKAGMVARVNLPTGPPQLARLVPKDALVLGGAMRVVYVIDIDPENETQGKVRPVPVQTGVSARGLIQISGEISTEELVVIEGNERLRPGQTVVVTKIRKSAIEK